MRKTAAAPKHEANAAPSSVLGAAENPTGDLLNMAIARSAPMYQSNPPPISSPRPMETISPDGGGPIWNSPQGSMRVTVERSVSPKVPAEKGFPTDKGIEGEERANVILRCTRAS